MGACHNNVECSVQYKERCGPVSPLSAHFSSSFNIRHSRWTYPAGTMLRIALLFVSITLAATETPCSIELACAECVPENMPLVTSHRAAEGRIALPAGAEVALSCGEGRLLAAPRRAAVAAVCEAGRFRLRHDGSLRHLLELGCQENIFQDVLHAVQYCASPLQGRAYQLTVSDFGGPLHVATVCFDEDRAVAVFAHASNALGNVLPMPPHNDQIAPLSLLGNFNHMFDANTRSAAEKLYSDDSRTNRRLHEMLKYEEVSLADQTLTSGKLLSGHYFEDQNMRVTDFVSNKVPVWSSVAAGNLRHVQRDVARLMRLSRPLGSLHVYAGAFGVASLRTERSRAQLFLRGERFPVPKYIWTVVHDTKSERALAVVVLNDPFVAVSEIRESVFCESQCARVAWLTELRRARRYETPLYGLSFCCAVHDFNAVVKEMPQEVLARVPQGDGGLLTELYT